MKLKTDFITNSSSASFVIAVKKETSIQELEEVLLKEWSTLESFVIEYIRYVEERDEFAEFQTLTEKVFHLAHILARRLRITSGMQIGDYFVQAEEGSNDGDSLFSMWLYVSQKIDNEKVKIQGFN